MNMIRVNEKRPCPVCGKPDWCLVAENGSKAICARIKEGSIERCGGAGYLHLLSGKKVNRRKILTKKIFIADSGTKDLGSLSKRYQEQLTVKNLANLSGSLGVSTQSLKQLGIGFDGKAYTFPMVNAEGKVIGISRRFRNGYKCTVTGSKTGLFVPTDLHDDKLLLVLEGLSDTAAALDLGFAATGQKNHGIEENTLDNSVYF